MIDTVNHIGTEKLIAIIRTNSIETALNASIACIKGGLSIVEVTLNTPGALEVIKELSTKFPHILMGAGTVLDIDSASKAIEAGAKFLVSPHTDESIIKYCRDNNVASCPGTTTPTEMVTAHRYGADMIKVFPASNLGGSSYIKNIRGPLPHLKLVPTGGIDINNVQDYIDAGVFAVGLSTALTPKKALESGDYSIITDLTREMITKLKT